jgi:hypothetical protein
MACLPVGRGEGTSRTKSTAFTISDTILISLTSHTSIITLRVYNQIESKEEVMMNKKILLLVSGIVMALVLLISPRGWAQPKPEIKGPIITRAFAVDKGMYGYIWKIYLEAEETDGEMQRIAVVVHQPGYGHYPTDWIYLKPQHQKRFKGYIQWNTFSSKASYLREWTQITLNVSIFNKGGIESNEVVFPFTFESGVGDQYRYKLPAPFDQGDVPKLGNIFIDLYEPTLMSGDGGARD